MMVDERNKGFTLVELTVSLAIFAFLLLVLYGILQTGTAVYFSDNVMLDLHQQARNGMNRIVREVRQSQSSSVTVVNRDSDILVFSTPNLVDVRYYRNGTNLVREHPHGQTRIIAVDIAHLKFTKIGTQLIINMRAQKVALNRQGHPEFKVEEFKDGQTPGGLLTAISVSGLTVPRLKSDIESLNGLLINNSFHEELIDKIKRLVFVLPDDLRMEDLLARRGKSALLSPGEVRSLLEINYPRQTPQRRQTFSFSLVEEVKLRNE